MWYTEKREEEENSKNRTNQTLTEIRGVLSRVKHRKITVHIDLEHIKYGKPFLH